MSQLLRWMTKDEATDYARWRGSCYEAAAKYVLSTEGEGATLVHGRPMYRGDKPGIVRFGHAWVEKDGRVVDVTIRDGHLGIDLPYYYLMGGLRDEQAELFRYDKEQILVHLCKQKHWGPWEGTESDGIKTNRRHRKKSNTKQKGART